jgi:hypothetical protein
MRVVTWGFSMELALWTPRNLVVIRIVFFSWRGVPFIELTTRFDEMRDTGDRKGTGTRGESGESGEKG